MKEFLAVKSKESGMPEATSEGTGTTMSSDKIDKQDGSFIVAAVQLSATGLDCHSIQGFWDRAQVVSGMTRLNKRFVLHKSKLM